MTAFTLRPATPADAPAIEALIARSVHGLQAQDYTQAQRDAAVGQVFLVDHGLIADRTYFVIEAADGRLAAAGGWSTRQASHGGHVHKDDGSRIDPATDPARIRAFFVDPDFARRGLGTRLLTACEDAARHAGFRTAMMGATLTGVPLYSAHGYREYDREEAPLPGGGSLTVVLMRKALNG
ncbi:GNAT family N-acetyltransferase [soil metagenome]